MLIIQIYSDRFIAGAANVAPIVSALDALRAELSDDAPTLGPPRSKAGAEGHASSLYRTGWIGTGEERFRWNHHRTRPS